MFCHIHHIVLTLHYLIFCFDLYIHSLNGKNFNNDDDIKSYPIQFFANKNQKFYERGIMMLKDGKRLLIKMGNTLQNKVI